MNLLLSETFNTVYNEVQLYNLTFKTLLFVGLNDRDELHFSEKQRLEQFQVNVNFFFVIVTPLNKNYLVGPFIYVYDYECMHE